jgi:hypothetical protein
MQFVHRGYSDCTAPNSNRYVENHFLFMFDLFELLVPLEQLHKLVPIEAVFNLSIAQRSR